MFTKCFESYFRLTQVTWIMPLRTYSNHQFFLVNHFQHQGFVVVQHGIQTMGLWHGLGGCTSQSTFNVTKPPSDHWENWLISNENYRCRSSLRLPNGSRQFVPATVEGVHVGGPHPSQSHFQFCWGLFAWHFMLSRLFLATKKKSVS